MRITMPFSMTLAEDTQWAGLTWTSMGPWKEINKDLKKTMKVLGEV